jgi:ribosomal protein L11 methyltransferase
VTTVLRRVSVRVPVVEAERARARLLELVPAGFEEVDLGSSLELVAYVEEPEAEHLLEAFPSARAAAVEPGWEDGWKRFHRPVVAGGVWLGPPWETPPPRVPAVVVEPGRAFGTGAHPTTRLCIEQLASHPPGSLLDVGCGTGVVALAGARLGFRPITAVDNDPVAVACARDNAARNRIALDVVRADALTEALPAARLAVVNILLPAVAAVLERLQAEVAITSGYLTSEAPVAPGWRRLRRLELDGWAADVFARK